MDVTPRERDARVGPRLSSRGPGRRGGGTVTPPARGAGQAWDLTSGPAPRGRGLSRPSGAPPPAPPAARSPWEKGAEAAEGSTEAGPGGDGDPLDCTEGSGPPPRPPGAGGRGPPLPKISEAVLEGRDGPGRRGRAGEAGAAATVHSPRPELCGARGGVDARGGSARKSADGRIRARRAARRHPRAPGTRPAPRRPPRRTRARDGPGPAAPSSHPWRAGRVERARVGSRSAPRGTLAPAAAPDRRDWAARSAAAPPPGHRRPDPPPPPGYK